MQNEFVAWVTGPERTLEEAFCAERLVEQGLETWRTRHEGAPPAPWEARRDYNRRRRLNPAHRVRITRDEARQGFLGLLGMEGLDFSAWEDRPLRDLSGLRFFSHFKTLALHRNELQDLAPLAGLTRLQHLSVSDETLEDLTPIGALAALRQLWIRVRLPWPKASAIGALERLEEFHWAGNLLALEDIPRLSRVRRAEFATGWEAVLPPRDCARLPEMPWVESLKLERVHRLEGITRWPRLCNLIVGGPFRDLEPLAGLRQLTHLQLEGNVTRDLSPLVRLPHLRRLVVRGSHPQDHSVLAEAPRLHEVVAEGCRINQMELATLHAVLPKWDEEFETQTPRLPGPLGFRSVPCDTLPQNPRRALGPEADWDGDAEMTASENRWMRHRLEGVLGRLLGPGWGSVSDWGAGPGGIALRICTMDAAERLAAVVDRTRAVLAGARWPWLVQLLVDLAEPAEAGPEAELSEEDEVRQELENQRQFKRRLEEEQLILEREHRLRLLQQEGRAVDPRTFTGKEEPGASAVPDGDEAGDVLQATAPLEDYSLKENVHPLAEALLVVGVISVDEFLVSDRSRRAAEHLMRRSIDPAQEGFNAA